MIAVLLGVLGFFVGALLNRIIAALMTDRQLRWLGCEHKAAGQAPLGLATVLALRGRPSCAVCGISPLLFPAFVEVVTAALFAGLWLRFGARLEFVLVAIYSCVFVSVFAIDLRWRLVPNKLVLPAMAFAVPAGFFSPGLPSSLVGGLVGFGLLLILFLGFPHGMGAGDVKLAALIGLVTGWPDVLLALMLGFLAGGLTAAVLLATKRVGLRGYFPYAPSLVLGAMTAMLFGKEIISWYLGR